MKKFLVFIAFLFSFVPIKVCADAAANGVIAVAGLNEANKLTKNSWFGNFFAAKGGVNLEQVMFSVDKNMNHGGAVTVHLVIVYKKELAEELSKMSSHQYFQCKDQLVKDHRNKIIIFEWELVAKKRITDWIDINYPIDHMVPVAAFVFINYSSPGEHRAIIPPEDKRTKITCESNDFNISCEDNNNEE